LQNPVAAVSDRRNRWQSQPAVGDRRYRNRVMQEPLEVMDESTKGTKVPLFVGRLRIPRATGMPFGTRTGYGSYLPRKNTKAGTDAAENTHNS
jgi:hypothetical protein